MCGEEEQIVVKVLVYGVAESEGVIFPLSLTNPSLRSSFLTMCHRIIVPFILYYVHLGCLVYRVYKASLVISPENEDKV